MGTERTASYPAVIVSRKRFHKPKGAALDKEGSLNELHEYSYPSSYYCQCSMIRHKPFPFLFPPPSHLHSITFTPPPNISLHPPPQTLSPPQNLYLRLDIQKQHTLHLPPPLRIYPLLHRRMAGQHTPPQPPISFRQAQNHRHLALSPLFIPVILRTHRTLKLNPQPPYPRNG